MNYLMLSVGRRCELLNDFRKSLPPDSRIIAANITPYAPALYFADKQYIIPGIYEPPYIGCVLDICKSESIDAVMTLIDAEIEILASYKDRFVELGVGLLVPELDTARICFDKYLMFQHLCKHGIPTVMTWISIEEFKQDLDNKRVHFPVFVKPRKGNGSIGARRIDDIESLLSAWRHEPDLIIQEFMDGLDLDADVYVDTISHEAVSAFCKRKLRMRIGGASQTVSFKDEKLFDFIRQITRIFDFNGPCDMDFFYRDGQYYLSEINPRFGGAYLHAYAAGVDFIKYIERNLHGLTNTPCFGSYQEGLVMMMYDAIVVKPIEDLAKR